jgi:Uri superfamily endonuclease
MKVDFGTYALILRSNSKATTQVGRWGQINLERGYYIYVGSAFGPGGVRARVSRHFREKKPDHWHIDYLGRVLSPVDAWCSYDQERLEHRWAQALSETTEVSSIPRFGCSDCHCCSHLFYSSTVLDMGLFSKIVACKIESWSDRLVDRSRNGHVGP